MPPSNNITVSVSLEDLGLSLRARVVLNAAGIKTVEQLRAKSDAELLKIRNIGTMMLQEIRKHLLLPFVALPIHRWTFEEQLRQERAYDLIVRTEEHIRRFLEHTLSKHYGNSWMSSGIPVAIQRKIVRRGGTVGPTVAIGDFLASLDFTDYKNLILYAPNWQLVFSSRLKNRQAVVAHLTRVNRHRRSVAHSRRLSEVEFACLEADVKLLTREFRLKR